MATTQGARRRRRGEVEELPSGALRVRVYAGIDPVTKKRHNLVETVPPGPKAAAQAEKVRTRLLAEVDAGRQPRTSVTVTQLMERYLEVVHVEPSTRDGYEGLVRNHIVPLLGDLQVGRIRGDVLDSFYAELRRCRRHCRRERSLVDHRTRAEHTCDERCRPHQCRPLGEWTVRHAHNLLNGAFSLAVRWEWIGTNPATKAAAPVAPTPNPSPPTTAQAARIASEAWREPWWGLFVWLAMTTGARRGELCALRWSSVDFAAGVLSIRSSIAEVNGKTWEKDTKTHQQRRIALDETTVALLRAHRRQCDEVAGTLGVALSTDAMVFSSDPDHRSWVLPSSVTQRYSRMCAGLGWDMNLHELRHYSATELIAGGVDVRTVAGRLGHAGGGTTTLKAYAAWVSEADQRAAGRFADHMPAVPVEFDEKGAVPVAPAVDQARASSPYLRIAADLRGAIASGVLGRGEALPTVVQLTERYGVSAATAHRAVAQLADAGLIAVSRGRRAVVL